MNLETIQYKVLEAADNRLPEVVGRLLTRLKATHRPGSCDCAYCNFIRNQYTPAIINYKRQLKLYGKAPIRGGPYSCIDLNYIHERYAYCQGLRSEAERLKNY